MQAEQPGKETKRERNEVVEVAIKTVKSAS